MISWSSAVSVYVPYASHNQRSEIRDSLIRGFMYKALVGKVQYVNYIYSFIVLQISLKHEIVKNHLHSSQKMIHIHLFDTSLGISLKVPIVRKPQWETVLIHSISVDLREAKRHSFF
jgi:hypothetical protein